LRRTRALKISKKAVKWHEGFYPVISLKIRIG